MVAVTLGKSEVEHSERYLVVTERGYVCYIPSHLQSGDSARDAAGDDISWGFGTYISQITIGTKPPSENTETQVNVSKKGVYFMFSGK